MIALWNHWLTDDVQTMTTGIRGSQNLWPNSSGELKWRNGCNYRLNQPFTVVWLYHLLDLSAWCVTLCPSQQLWSCKNGQFTLPHFFMDKLDKVINQYFVHILWLVKDNNLSWFSWRGRQTMGINPWSTISTRVWSRSGLELKALDFAVNKRLQPDTLPTVLRGLVPFIWFCCCRLKEMKIKALFGTLGTMLTR